MNKVNLNDEPPLMIPFHAGVRAFNEPRFKGTLVSNTNPYPKDTMANKEWERGFNHAYFSTKALVSK